MKHIRSLFKESWCFVEPKELVDYPKSILIFKSEENFEISREKYCVFINKVFDDAAKINVNDVKVTIKTSSAQSVKLGVVKP